MRNGYKSYLTCNGEGIVLSVDGTYKLSVNEWPLLILGTDQCLESTMMKHSMLPILFAWVMSEPQHAYEALMQAYIDSLMTFFGVVGDINVATGICDHADAIRYSQIRLNHETPDYFFYQQYMV